MSIRLATNALHIKDGESYDTIDVLRGAKGETGTTPDLTIGTVTTGAPGTSASATITGTDEDPVLNLTIPRGDTGTVNVDSELSTTSTNPVQNKVITNVTTQLSEDITDLQDALDGKVDDVQINGTSVITDGVANIPIANSNAFGAVKVGGTGVSINSAGVLAVVTANDNQIKAGTNYLSYLVPQKQHSSVFYGLAKAASDTTQSASSNPVGTYTDAAKVAIQKMLGLNQQGELIADVTTTEDMTRFTINTDINGEAFRLRKMIAIFEAPPSTTGARDTLRCELGYVNMQDANASTSTPAMQFPTATSQMMTKITVEAEPGIPISIWTSIGNSEGNSGNVVSMPKPDIAKAIRAFSVYQSATTQSLVPSGSRMRIYGIRV